MIGIKDMAKPAVPKQEENKFSNLLNSVFGGFDESATI